MSKKVTEKDKTIALLENELATTNEAFQESQTQQELKINSLNEALAGRESEIQELKLQLCPVPPSTTTTATSSPTIEHERIVESESLMN